MKLGLKNLLIKVLSFALVLVLFGGSIGANVYADVPDAGEEEEEEEQPLVLEGNLEAELISTVTGQTVNVKVSGINSDYDISKVKFIFKKSSGKTVYTTFGSLQENGEYTSSVSAKKLNPKYGLYKVEAELTDINNNTVTLEPAEVELPLAYTTVKLTKANRKKGIFTLTTDKIYVATSKVKSVTFKVSCNGKSYDYVASKNSAGKYTAQVDVGNHKCQMGDYQVSAVVKLKNKKTYVAATTSFEFNEKNFIYYGKTDRKKFVKKIYLYNSTFTKDLYLKVSSKKSKNTDLKIYKGSYKNGNWTFKVKMKDLKESGKINMVFCTKSGNKYKKVLSDVYVAGDEEIQKCGWYYEKAKNGKTYKYYYSKGKKKNDMTKVLDLKKEKLHIEVNRETCRVTVYAYDSKTESWCIPVIAFKCSVGVSSMATPAGTFYTDRNHRWKELMGPSWGQYATHFVGGVYFHSVAGSTTDSYGISARQYNKLGSPASHGCVRLTVRDAKWLYDHAKIGSQVRVYDSAYAGPLSPQFVPKIPADQHYDPTDPAVKDK